MIDALHIDALRVGYRNTPVLHDLSVPHIAPGRLIGILGRNAAGKSTLLRALAGQLGYAGSARLGARELRTLAARERALLVSYLPQSPVQASRLLALEVGLSLFRSAAPDLASAEAERRIVAAFRAFELEPFALRPVDELSGGKRQLLGLALALARRPRLLLLDEPTSALDLRWQLCALDAVRGAVAREAMIALVAVHDINLALRYCDELLVLDAGRLLVAGRTEAVLDAALLRRAFNVDARIERCSRGRPIVLIDGPCNAPIESHEAAVA